MDWHFKTSKPAILFSGFLHDLVVSCLLLSIAPGIAHAEPYKISFTHNHANSHCAEANSKHAKTCQYTTWPHRIAVEVRRGTLNTQDRGWGPARNTGLTGSRLRSGAEHWTHRIAVEVRRGTLASQDRGWGPARNTELTGSRLRSGAEHWPHIIARGDGGRDEEGEGGEGGGGQGWHKI